MKTQSSVMPPVPTIPINHPISWEDWLAGRHYQRKLSESVSLQGSQRPHNYADHRLRKEFAGKRGVPSAEMEAL